MPPRLAARWTLEVRAFGRIEKAVVDLHPLLLFVGENNSGKSYLATLLWTLHGLDFGSILAEGDLALPEIAACDTWIVAWLNRQGKSATLGEQELGLLLAGLNALLHIKRRDIAEHAFNNPDVRLEELVIRDYHLDGDLAIVYNYDPGPGTDGSIAHDLGDSIEWSYTAPMLPNEIAEHPELRLKVLADLLSCLLNPIDDHVYLPASRTGFTLLAKAVVRQAPRRKGRENVPLRLTAPMEDFVDLLVFRLDPMVEGPLAAEAGFLEEQCLGGRVELEPEVGMNQILYRPLDTAPLPMSLSSSLVTELAPIVLILRHHTDGGFIVLEEPEAHLHPRLQRIIAQVIVRLIHKGIRICITTHSENFCQQINNFIKIGTLAEASRVAVSLGYTSQDFLRSEDIAAYEFKLDGGRAHVTRLPQSDTGITMPLFNDELLKLSEETLKLQDMLAREADEA